jgi:glycosyltransferase involved in cell wall biosynthesis|tara:strand:+ start:226 stop:1254 length:1029 start_codon:yes stop_codon:yes gene_type:complete
MDSAFLISIITPTYNRADELAHLFHSIEKQNTNLEKIELIISDDGSTDGTKALVQLWKEKVHYKIKYISQENKGPGAARNHGLKTSSGDLILFIDSDCEAHPDWIKLILNDFRKNKFGAFGGPDGAKEDFTDLQKAIDYSMTSMFTTGGIRGHSDKMLSKFFPRTHNMGISREIYNLVGGFGNLRHGQDIEFSNRIRKAGAKISFIKKALVYHRRRTSLKQFFKQVFNWGVARVNLGKIDSDMLEPIHFLPTLSILVTIISLPLLSSLNLSVLVILLIFFLPLLFLSIYGAYIKNEIKILPLLLLVIPIQIMGYGIGFLQAYIRRFLFNKNELIGFNKNYYK